MIKIRKKTVGMQIVGNKPNQGNVQRKISFSIHSPTFILLAIGFVLQNLPAKTESNPTAPNIYLENYSGDFTDSDQDGMSDIAELRYGFDPEDKSSFPRQSYFLDDLGITINDITDDSKIGSSSDRIYFYFSKFSHSLESRTRSFMIKLFPILYNKLGNPSRTIACKLHNRGGSSGSWMASSSGTRIYANNTWNPRLLVHEIIHVWSGKYKFASNHNWQWDNMLSGFEEVAEGMAYEIIHDFIEAYPNDPESIIILKGGAWDEWSGRFSNYDLNKHQRRTEGGDFWVGPLTSNDRYNISSVLMQIFMKHDEDFYRKIYKRFYETIESDPNFFPTRENIIELWSSVVPTVNGIPTKHYLEAMPILNCNKLKPELYAIALPDGKFSNGGRQKLFCVFPDNQKGEFWWSSSIYDSNMEQYGIPSWFGQFKGSDNYYYTDNRKQAYTVKVRNSMGILLSTIHDELNNPTRSTDGGPSTIATSTPSSLYGKNYEIGLYKMTLEFPNYKKFTENYTEDSYFFGYRDFKQAKNRGRTVMLGIDCLSESSNAKMVLNGKSYFTKMKNGCAIFEIESLNEEGVAKFLIHSEDRNRTNTYQRAIIIGGTADGYRHQPILIIDKDFDGNEDIYEIYQEVIAFKENEADKNSSSVIEVITQPESLTKIENNSTSVADIDNSIEDAPHNLDLNITWINNGIRISWNQHMHSIHYLEVLHNQVQLIYGGHADNHAMLYPDEHNLTGTEFLNGRFLKYKDSKFISYVENFSLNLNEIVPTETNVVILETNNSTILIDGVKNIQTDDSNTSIINTETNVVIIEDILTIEVVDDSNESLSSNDINIFISDDNVTLINDNEISTEENATNSVIIVSVDKVTIQKDTTKLVDGSLSNEKPAAPPLLKSAWADVISVGQNWYYIKWFGYFFQIPENNWIYHENLGWFYLDWTTTFESIWLYHENLGWTWTNADCFPYLFNQEKNIWYYLTDNHYFDFKKNKWFKIEK
jgi:hypothetical protein